MTEQYDVMILGAGPAGLTAAAAAAMRGRRVLVLDRNARPGVKLLLAGGGKANLTNRFVSSDDYVGDNPSFTTPALARFTPDTLLRRLAASGIAVEEREYGQIFCKSSARALLDMLLAATVSCRLCSGAAVDAAAADPRGFALRCGSAAYHAPKLILATGSPAWPQCGADDSGLRLARGLGHRIVPVRPVLAPLILPPESPLAGLAGISAPATVRCGPPGSPAFTAPLLFTHKGLSGPAALQVSCWWHKGAALFINFLPQADASALLDAATGKATPLSILSRHLPDRLCRALLPPDLADRRVAELSRANRNHMADALHAHKVVPLRLEGLHKAEAAAGGVDTAEVNPRTMESLRLPGLFFCGEILDVAGRLGGYNLHWAWASGELAGLSA